jgi:hypothetical protein
LQPGDNESKWAESKREAKEYMIRKTGFPHMVVDLKKEAYVVYSELPRGEAAIISSVCDREATGDPSMN